MNELKDSLDETQIILPYECARIFANTCTGMVVSHFQVHLEELWSD